VGGGGGGEGAEIRGGWGVGGEGEGVWGGERGEGGVSSSVCWGEGGRHQLTCWRGEFLVNWGNPAMACPTRACARLPCLGDG